MSDRDRSAVPSHTEMPDTLGPGVAHYFRAGGDTGSTVALNAAAWQRWSLVPFVLRDVSTVDPSADLLGQTMASPILVAPMSGLNNVHPEAEVELARGATTARVTFCLTSGSSRTVEEVAGAAGPYLQQLYVWDDRERVLPFVDRAVTAGARAFVLTVDSPPQAAFYGFRARVFGLTPVDSPHFADGRPPSGSPANLVASDIAWLAERSGVPVLVKGVLHPDDAVAAVDAGAAGIIVSNHGGRQIDGSITTAEALPDIAEAVAQRVPVLVDGGVRQAEDVVRALALGATAVLLGRPLAWALGHGGADAVAAALSRLQYGVVAQLALCGVTAASDVPRDLVRWRSWG